MYNAAGVAYTLAPSAVASTTGSSSGDGSGGSVGQQWGLLPGLDASAVLWALLSGENPAAAASALLLLLLLLAGPYTRDGISLPPPGNSMSEL